MTTLIPGANVGLTGSSSELCVKTSGGKKLGDYAGIVLLPLDEQRRPNAEPQYMHQSRFAEWVRCEQDNGHIRWQLNLGLVPSTINRLMAVIYVYGSAGPLSQLGELHFSLEQVAEYHIKLKEHPESALVALEFYRRGDGWKLRALEEGSAYGLAALGRRWGIEFDERHPNGTQPPFGHHDSGPQQWTGTAFLVDATHMLTCAHVLEGASQIEVVSFSGRRRGEPVLMDTANDIALVRIHEPADGRVIAFRDGPGCFLGAPISTMGYPLSSVMGAGLQVTQGGVSGLFGPQGDSSLLQFTAPIQPGSSGSPLFDAGGLAVGMVTSSVTQAQNMNFAVKSSLILSFLEAAGLDVKRELSSKSALDLSELTRAMQRTIWRVECVGR